MNNDTFEVLWKVAMWVVMPIVMFPLNFLFTYAWNHSLVEFWPNLIPVIGYWQGYLLLIVVHFIFPAKPFPLWREK